jgi:predicted DNA-binding protein
MTGARVHPDVKQWISDEAKRRDRPEAYIVRELLEEGIERRRREREEEAVPA